MIIYYQLCNPSTLATLDVRPGAPDRPRSNRQKVIVDMVLTRLAYDRRVVRNRMLLLRHTITIIPRSHTKTYAREGRWPFNNLPVPCNPYSKPRLGLMTPDPFLVLFMTRPDPTRDACFIPSSRTPGPGIDLPTRRHPLSA